MSVKVIELFYTSKIYIVRFNVWLYLCFKHRLERIPESVAMGTSCDDGILKYDLKRAVSLICLMGVES